MARPGPANSRRARHSGDFFRRRQQNLKLNRSRRLMVTGLLRVLPVHGAAPACVA
jgi:hypothetical protein